MKKRILTLLIFVNLISCTKSENIPNSEFFGNWRLIKMTGSSINSESKGKDMEWKESYLFNENGTFQKFRETDKCSFVASGTFKVKSTANETTIELLFDYESNILGSCYSSTLKEILVQNSENSLYNTWSNCDGPRLEYRKIN
ncbi:hypothetical protein [Maribacter aurantiacus]|uniref:Lipocalin-like domain-containing protein n=1 Tax=Maribacter aurantiacus TaxID=1882343 RepID=A0A5R8M6R9_9FLAO|nr:hypothetical protein [Maribacter aurantiacus]TLF45278.1 hypothetical protein FEK29_07795 [Maribacter aurantiacus]